MEENHKLRANARAQLKGNWGKPILVSFLYGIITIMISAIPFFGGLINLLVIGSFMVGSSMYALKFKRSENPDTVILFEGFKNYGSTLGLYLWYSLWVFLWSLLLIIPGIIKGLAYSMCFNIMADNPHIGIRNALSLSKKITYGYKGKLFMLQLGFIGWALLSILTLGIGLLWLIPYIAITYANFYDQLKADNIRRGICVAEEF